MAKLYFRYGAMGSSKTANALMVEYNYFERGKKALLVKPLTDQRDGKYILRSRIGLEKECILLEDLIEMTEKEIKQYDCIIIDEAQDFGPSVYYVLKQVLFQCHLLWIKDRFSK